MINNPEPELTPTEEALLPGLQAALNGTLPEPSVRDDLLERLIAVLEPIVHHQKGTYNHWRYVTHHGKHGGAHGMKYEDAVRALPGLYEELKASV